VLTGDSVGSHESPEARRRKGYTLHPKHLWRCFHLPHAACTSNLPLVHDPATHTAQLFDNLTVRWVLAPRADLRTPTVRDERDDGQSTGYTGENECAPSHGEVVEQLCSVSCWIMDKGRSSRTVGVRRSARGASTASSSWRRKLGGLKLRKMVGTMRATGRWSKGPSSHGGWAASRLRTLSLKGVPSHPTPCSSGRPVHRVPLGSADPRAEQVQQAAHGGGS
jgi:hypothetical protein